MPGLTLNPSLTGAIPLLTHTGNLACLGHQFHWGITAINSLGHHTLATTARTPPRQEEGDDSVFLPPRLPDAAGPVKSPLQDPPRGPC